MNIFLKGPEFYYVVACLFSLIASPACAEIQKNSGQTNVDLVSLDKRLHQFSSRFYAKLIRSDNYPKIATIDLLIQTMDSYRKQNQPLRATATVINNLGLVEKHIDTTPIINISELLLATNEWGTAAKLYKSIKEQGDKSLLSQVSLLHAQYYFSRNQWQKTLDIAAGIGSDLAPEDYHHALLMQGISLQQLHKHRVALAPYSKIPTTSRYYTAARLNMAVANIRQDWWTDAHIIIDDLLNDKGRNSNGALTDRLYTVLGYSLLRQQYFRNARDAFRNVSLDGQYTNKALLGLALTAAYQEDYVGALNAIKILKDKQSHDLPVDEANLLMPYFYEKLQQPTTASIGYAQAIKYYENRADNIQDAMSINIDHLKNALIAGNANRFTIKGEIVDLEEKLPKFFFENIRLLDMFRPHVDRFGDAKLAHEYNVLVDEYKSALLKTAQTVLNEKASHLLHYMSQSRYGLARMQDTDATIPQ